MRTACAARPSRSCRSAPSARWRSASGLLLDHDRFAAALAHPLDRVLIAAVSDTRRLAAVAADHHDLARRERHRLLDDPALRVLGRVCLRVALGHVDAGHDDLAVVLVDLLDAATLPAVLARDHHDLIALAHFQ